MKTTTRICALRLMCRGSLLLLITAVVISGCGGKATPAPEPTAAPAAVAGLANAPTATKATAPTPPALSGDTIALPSGGSLVAPAGALSKGTRVDVAVTQMPVLPDDVEPVGEAIAITAAVQPAEPVMLRLPIPTGVVTPGELVIIRVEPDGATTFLITQVEDGDLVAYTPGFSTFAIGRSTARKLILEGPVRLLPGQRAMYRVYDTLGMMFGAVAQGWWKLTGPATIVHQSSTAVTIEGGSEEAELQLIYECIDPTRGEHWWGRALITVSEQVDPGEAELRLSAYTTKTVVYADEEVRIRAEVSGEYTPPITWRWNYGDGAPEGTTTTQKDGRALDLPPKVYAPRPNGYYPVSIRVQDAAGRSAWTEVLIHARAEATALKVEGPTQIEWKSPGFIANYKAVASIGPDSVTYGRDREYRFDWELQPEGGEHSATIYAAAAGGDYTTGSPFPFAEPGEYRLKVVLTNVTRGDVEEGRAVLPIHVTGGQGLSGYIEDMPASARPDEQVSVKLRIRGGILVLAGKKGGYTVQVDWGDGSPPTVEKNVGAARKSSEGTAFTLAHKWAKSNTYRVSFVAYDATGTAVRDAREITITGAESVPSPSAPKTNTPPLAEDITTSTTAGADVAITLKGSDTDGDKLTYTFTRPANGAVTGTAPFLTYKPKAGFSGTDTFTYKVRDGQADSRTATVTITVEGLQWVRVGEPLINATDPKERLEYYGGGSQPDYFGEERFMGKFTVYRLSETLIAMDDREVDHGYEYWNITYESRFDVPPAVLTPAQMVTLTVKLSASGSVTEGMPPTVRFQYGTDRGHRGAIQPDGPVGYNPWFTDNPGVDNGSWTLTVPQGRPGDTFQVWAGWWNCAMCNVTWTYRYGGE